MIIYYDNYIKYFFVYFLILFSILSVSTQLKSQTSEIKDCNGNNISTQIIVTSSNNQILNISNCTFSNGALSAYLNCIRTNNPSLPATASLIVELSADPASGISGLDLELLKQEVLQKNIISNTCNRAGSDSDLNNKLNTIDLCLIRKHIAGISNINPSWKFYKSQNLSLTGIEDSTDLIFPITDFPLSTLNVIAVHNGNVNQVTTPNDTCVLLCKPDLRITPGQDEVRKLTPDYFLLNKSCSFSNLSLQILNASGQVIGNEITQNMVGNQLTAKLQIGNTTQICTTKLTVYPCEVYVNIDVDQTNTTDSTFVDVSVRNAEFISGYQLSLKFDTTHLQFVKIEKGNEPGFNANNDAHYNGRGHVNISRFNETSNLGLEEDTRLFRIKFKRKSSIINNVVIDPENVESLFFDINKAEYCTNITYLLDTNPPVCLQDTIMLQGDNAVGYATLKFTDYASDDFGTVFFESGVNEFDFPITNLDTFECGTNILTYVIFKDANGQSKQCIFRVIVDCPSDTCLNKYLYFDGVNDRVNIPNQHTGNVEFTIECFFLSKNSLDVGQGIHRLFTLGSSSRLELGDRQGKLFIFNGNGITTNPSIRDNLWHHVALVKEEETLKLYLDGELIQNVPYTFVDLQSIRVGYFNNQSLLESELWKGGIDEIKLWNYALTQDEINSSKNKINTKKKDCGLIGYWRMEEGTPNGNNQAISMVRDSVGNNNGALVGFNLTGDVSNFLCNDSLMFEIDNISCCQSSFTFSTNCNRIILSGMAEGFNNPSSIMYNYTSTNTNFISTSKDAVFNYFGDLPEVIICLEASDGVCSATFCDTIPVTLPMPPVFPGCPGSISLSSVDSCSWTFPLNIPLATDPCTGMPAMVGCLRSDGLPLSASFPLGVTTITCTASSVLGTQFDALCVFDIEILDETKPICIPKNAEIYLDNLGFTTFSPQLIDGGSSDNCGEITLSIEGQQTFTCADVGNQIKTLIVSDESNNTSTCQATIIVRDTIRPICNGKTLNKIINGNGNASFAAIDLNDNSSDNCGNLTFTASKTMFNCADVRITNIITLTVTDQSGNSSSCPVEVKLTDPNDYCGCLSDVTAPVCKSKNITLNLDASGNVNLTPEMINDGSFDFCSDVSLQIEGPIIFECTDIGRQVVNLIVTDMENNVSFCSAEIVVRDNLRPLCSLEQTYFLDQNGLIALNNDNPNITLNDNCGPVNITNPKTFDCNDIGNFITSLTVSDNSGNTYLCFRNINIRDTIRPTCTIPPKTFYLQGNGQVLVTQNQLNISSKDNCFGVTSFFNNTNYNCSDIGMKPVSAKVQDASGNMNTCFTLITIRDTIRPFCGSRTINKSIGSTGNVSILATELNNSSRDNCGPSLTFTASKTVFTCNDLDKTNIISLTVTDQSGNSSSCPAEVIITDPNNFCACINDVTGPVCKTKKITLDLDTTGNALLTPQLIDDNSFDACSDITLQIEGPQSFDCNSVGSQIVNLVVTDQANNVSFCTADVTVQDKQLPNCLITPAQFHLDQSGNVALNIDNLVINSSDNCSGVTATFDSINYSCDDIGENTIIVTVTDVSGNTNSCSTVITISDTIKPICNIETKTYYLDVSGQVSLTQTHLNITAKDNCTGVTTAFDIVNYTCNDIGTKNISATVRDVAGNTNTCSAQITIRDTIRPVCKTKILNKSIGDNGSITITAIELNDNSTDNCGNITFSASKTIFSCADLGNTNIVTLMVTDQSGNSSSCPVEVKLTDPNNYCACLNDVTAPVCKTKNITVNLDAAGNVSITPAMINDGSFDVCTDVTLQIEGPQSFDCNSIGNQTVSLVVTDVANNVSFCPTTITIVDEIAPDCILVPSTYYLDQQGLLSLSTEKLNISTNDNCSNVLVEFNTLVFTCSNIGSSLITARVTDESGNTNVCSTIIMTRDTIRPFCSLPSRTYFLDESGSILIDKNKLGLVNSDNCGTLNTNFTNVIYNCNDLGQKLVSIIVFDASGNTSMCSSFITIKDTIAPKCSIPTNTYFLDTNGQASLTQTQLNITANDNCVGVTTTFNTVNYTCNDIGVKTISATVRDVAGNTNACTAQITINDTIRPICFIRDTIVTSTDGVGAMVNFNGRAIDNCAEGLTLSYSQPSGQFYPCGEYNITMTARDNSGNISTCPFKLTVKDCDDCCLSEQAFMDATSVELDLTSDLISPDDCMVQFISPKLSLCQIVTEISWGDGTVSRGSFTNAVDFTHQYTEPAIYEVCVTYEEESTQRCFENKICNTFEVLDNCTLKRSDATFDYNKIIIFPNPTTGSFNVSGGSIFTHYEMMDQLGRAVIAKRPLEKENDISQLQNGLYFIRLHVGSIIISKTIIKIQ